MRSGICMLQAQSFPVLGNVADGGHLVLLHLVCGRALKEKIVVGGKAATLIKISP